MPKLIFDKLDLYKAHSAFSALGEAQQRVTQYGCCGALCHPRAAMANRLPKFLSLRAVRR